MNSVILDACVTGDFFEQYFSRNQADRGNGNFSESLKLSKDAVARLNRILRAYRSRDEAPEGKVIIPPLALIELVRKWDEIVANRFTVSSLEAVVASPPDWMVIASWDESLIPSFIRIPREVYLGGQSTSVEWTDGIYPATALSYGEGNAVATTDRKLLAMAGLVTNVVFV